MRNLINVRNTFTGLLTIILALSLSAPAFAGPDEKTVKSGDGPHSANYRDRDDDDRWDHQDHDRDDRVIDRREIRRRAVSIGYRAGLEIGRRDRLNRRGFNFRDDRVYQVATLGYRRQYRGIEFYRLCFREGFREGYARGYRSGDSRW